MWMPPVKKRSPEDYASIRFFKVTPPIIRLPWYRRLWRWLLGKPPYTYSSLRETIAGAPSMKAEWADGVAYAEHLESVTKKGPT